MNHAKTPLFNGVFIYDSGVKIIIVGHSCKVTDYDVDRLQLTGQKY